MDWPFLLLSPRLWIAITVYLATAMAVDLLFERWQHRHKPDRLEEWLLNSLFRPMARALALLFLILLAYPLLFAPAQPPPFSTLVNVADNRLNLLMSITMATAVFLPLIPLFTRRPDIILPVQGWVLSAVMFGWLANYREMEQVHYWPGYKVALLLIALVVVAPLIARRLARFLAIALDLWLGKRRYEWLLYEWLLLAAQLPALFIYAWSLARQVPVTAG